MGSAIQQITSGDELPEARITSRVTVRVAIATALAGVYFATAVFGLHFALVNPSATALWAPAGISLAACVLFGPWVWPGVLAGAFFSNWMVSTAASASLAIAIGN